MLVKICGIKDLDVLTATLEAGADFIGLVFFPKSPRHVGLDQAAKLAQFVRYFSSSRSKQASSPQVVALVVNPTDEELKTIVQVVSPDYIQLHGQESPLRANEILSKFNTPLIKAVGICNAQDATLAEGYGMAEIILFDAKADPKISELPGGNGIPFDWQALKGQKEARDFMLSGGLTAQNVAEAISLTGASIVDVSSGVETAPGVKDLLLIKAFIEAAKEL